MGPAMKKMKDMDMVKPLYQMVTHTRECMKMVNGMVKGFTGNLKY